MKNELTISPINKAIPQDIIDVLSSNGVDRDAILLKKISVDRLCELLVEGNHSIDDLCKVFGVSRYAMVRELNQSDILAVIATYMRVSVVQDVKNYTKTILDKDVNGNEIEVPDIDAIKLADLIIKKKMEIANNFSPVKKDKEDTTPSQDINIITVDSDSVDRSIQLHENPNGFVERESSTSSTSKEEEENTKRGINDMLNSNSADDEPFDL